MAWVYYIQLVDTKFQATCLLNRLEDKALWLSKPLPKQTGIFQTRRGQFGVKAFW